MTSINREDVFKCNFAHGILTSRFEKIPAFYGKMSLMINL